MATVSSEHEIRCSAEDAWQILSDFGFFLEWAAGGAGSIEVRGEGIGMSRHLDIPGVGKMSERLQALDNEAMSLAYELMESGPSGMDTYRCQVKVEPVTTGRSRLHWNSEFEPLAGVQAEVVSGGLEGAYQAMSHGLESYINHSK
jgi:carbon monoxide dehydrogenase subunit G